MNNYVTDFTSGISTEAVKQGLNPNDVIRFIQNMGHNDFVEFYKAKTGRQQQQHIGSIANEARVSSPRPANHYSNLDPNKFRL